MRQSKNHLEFWVPIQLIVVCQRQSALKVLYEVQNC